MTTPPDGARRPRPGLRVGLTGGIAAGKSAATARLAELGAGVVDHDVLARRVVEPGSPGLAQVVAAFGPEVLAPDGSLDRPALAALVFGDDAARARLDAVVHPLVRAAARDAEAALVAGGHGVVVHDIPLLVETGQAGAFDVVVVVTAPRAVRLERLVRGRGLTPEAARARVAAQADDAVREAAADVVLDGSGTPEGLRAQVDRLWASWGAGASAGGAGDGAAREAGARGSGA